MRVIAGFIAYLLLLVAAVAGYVVGVAVMVFYSLPFAVCLWLSWIYSGLPLTGVHISLGEMIAATFFILTLKTIIQNGVVPQEVAAWAAKTRSGA